MIEFLKSTPLFQGISTQEIESILPLLKIRRYEKGELILREGEEGDAFYLIKSGQVEILKKEESSHSLHQINTLGPNEWFGEMAFLGEGIRQSSVRALEQTEAIAIPTRSFLTQAETHPIFSKISINFTKKISRHLCHANEQSVKSTEKQITLLKSHDQMGRLIVYLFLILTLYFYSVKISEEFHSNSLISVFFDSILIAVVGVFGLIVVKQSHYPLEFYGITFKNGWKHAKEAFLWTLPVLLMMVALKWFLITFISQFNKMSLFGDAIHSGFIILCLMPQKSKGNTIFYGSH